jgi:zinc-ribbon domain
MGDFGFTCPHCGAQNPPYASYCSLCLATLECPPVTDLGTGVKTAATAPGGDRFTGTTGWEQTEEEKEESAIPDPAYEQYQNVGGQPPAPQLTRRRRPMMQLGRYLIGFALDITAFLIAIAIVTSRESFQHGLNDMGAVVFLVLWGFFSIPALMGFLPFSLSPQARMRRSSQKGCAVLVIISSSLVIMISIFVTFAASSGSPSDVVVPAVLGNLALMWAGILQLRDLAPITDDPS